jgi:hypothetical protein
MPLTVFFNDYTILKCWLVKVMNSEVMNSDITTQPNFGIFHNPWDMENH